MELGRQGGEKDGEQPASQEDLKVGIDGQLGQWGAGQRQQQIMGATGVGFDVSGVGFPNMGWNGPNDFQTMMGPVQPVMPNASWGSFPNAMGKKPPVELFAWSLALTVNFHRHAGYEHGSDGYVAGYVRRRIWRARHEHERHEHGDGNGLQCRTWWIRWMERAVHMEWRP
jgi:hypothetical protein